ncbi:MAG: hypothetical protein DWQ07_21660 [Chloroflexi bacterium]|nr:MAG: hypothetical protein DWQ07_21660 [Chloroflexota bacterium]MBL1196570.1 hypothetical protein [Chloroflexota bacterium]NOH13865.1 hypothetical protein [Chloroflexota bacterium]
MSQNPEPSVLDVFKSWLTPWKGKPILIPELDEEAVVAPTSIASIPDQEERVDEQDPLIGIALRFPWFLGIPLGIALLVQLRFDDTASRPRTLEEGLWLLVGFYLLAVAWQLWRHQKGDWLLTSPREIEHKKDTLAFRPVFLVAGLFVGIAAFYTLEGNQFTLTNVALWLAALFLVVYGLWSPGNIWGERWANLRARLQKPNFNFSISGWTLLVLGAFLVAAFFRFYRIADVPGEMVSDHAEKLYDVFDVMNGEPRIFFPRNAGREPIQFYLVATLIKYFNTGYTFLSLKLSMVIMGFVSLIYVYLLGKEVGNKRVGLLALVLFGMAFWPNLLARTGMRLILYPAFTAPVLFYTLRGIRRSSRNDYLLAGGFLGIGLMGYTATLLLPVVVVTAFGLYLLHKHSAGVRLQTIVGLALVTFVALVAFLPLARFAYDEPEIFNYRTGTRVGSDEVPLPGPPLQIFLQNLGDALVMTHWDDGEVWVISVAGRPALDVLSAVFYAFGVALLLYQYIRKRHWLYLFLLISIPILMLPSVMSLAFPAENPHAARAGGAAVVIFVIVALAIEGLLSGMATKVGGSTGKAIATVTGVLIVLAAASQNYSLVFSEYDEIYRRSAWNTSEMGAVVADFTATMGSEETVWIVGYPHWADSRLVMLSAGYPYVDKAIFVENFETTLKFSGAQLFIVNPDHTEALDALESLYPRGWVKTYDAAEETKDFLIYFVPPQG